MTAPDPPQPEYVNQWPAGYDLTHVDNKSLTAYIVHKTWAYGRAGGLRDYSLWEQFQEDFQGVTKDHFKLADGDRNKALRDLLRHNGVWVLTGRGVEIASALANCAREDEPVSWTKEAIQEHVKNYGNFNSYVIDNIIKTGGSAIKFGTGDPPLPPSPQLGIPAPYVKQKDPARDITNLSKMYTDSQKYGGQDDNFDFKLIIFNTYCTQLNIDDAETMAKAFSVMLKGEAFQHFLTNQRNTTVQVPFENLCKATRDYFETPEYKRNQLNKWNSITLRSVISDPANSSKSQSECLQLLIAELRKIQPGLDMALRTDEFLHNKLVTACQDMKSCEYACFQPPESLSALVSALQSSIITHEKSNPPPSTDRRYRQPDNRSREHRDDRRLFRPPPSRFQPRERGRPSGKKRCWICKKRRRIRLERSDAGFARKKDVGPISTHKLNANIVTWSSIKCKRVTRSILASELFAMAHGFDSSAVIKATAELITQSTIPLVIATDSRSIYECLVKLGTTQEKRLMVDLMCIRQSYERRSISEIKWIDGESNPADAMTKSKCCQALLVLIDMNKINLDTKRWVERSDEEGKKE
jgi:hypothetical protein